MDDLNITLKEYIRLEEEKAQRHGKVFNWETAKYDKDNDDDKDDIEHSSGDLSIKSLPDVINTDVGAYAQRYQYDVSWGMDTAYRLPV
nr:hypothetical protein [Tanacetum cinerariifolium]